MVFPNKVASFSESTFANSIEIIKDIPSEGISVEDLYIKQKDKVDDIEELVSAITILYALGKIDYNAKTGEIKNAI